MEIEDIGLVFIRSEIERLRRVLSYRRKWWSTFKGCLVSGWDVSSWTHIVEGARGSLMTLPDHCRRNFKATVECCSAGDLLAVVGNADTVG